MPTQKKIYIVSGSEDGNLAVCTNVKEAYKVVTNYLEIEGSKVKESYSQVVKGIKETGYITCNRDNSTYATCDITLFYTNNY